MTAALFARVELGWGAFFVKRAPQKTLHVLRLVEVEPVDSAIFSRRDPMDTQDHRDELDHRRPV